MNDIITVIILLLILMSEYEMCSALPLKSTALFLNVLRLQFSFHTVQFANLMRKEKYLVRCLIKALEREHGFPFCFVCQRKYSPLSPPEDI